MDPVATNEQETTECLPLTSYPVPSTSDGPATGKMSTQITTPPDGFSTLPVFAFFLGNSTNSGYGLPGRLWSGYVNNHNPYCTSPRYINSGTAPVYSNNGTTTWYSNNGGTSVNMATYRGQGSDNFRIIKLTRKNIIIITATIVSLVVIAIIGSLSYYCTKKSEEDVTFYGTLLLHGLDYDDNYDNMTSQPARDLSRQLCYWLINDVTTKVQTDISFNTCQVTGYRRGSVLTSFQINASIPVGCRDKINVLETEIIKDMLLAAILTKSEPKLVDLDIVITYLNVYKMLSNTTQSPDKTVGSTVSTVSKASTVSTMTDVNTVTTEPLSQTTPTSPCSSNPCPIDITCVDIGDDFFCECQVCNCTADLVDKTCGTIASNITGSCADLGDGYYPVVTDCTQYLWCYPGRNATQPCAIRTAYDPDAPPCNTPRDCSVNFIRKAPTED